MNHIVRTPKVLKDLKVTTFDGETICRVEAAKSIGWLRIYDLAGAGPPVLRTIDSGSVKRVEPCTEMNAHQENLHSYTNEELVNVAALLDLASHPHRQCLAPIGSLPIIISIEREPIRWGLCRPPHAGGGVRIYAMPPFAIFIA